MNKWVKESEKLAKRNFYLDNLMKIYPPEEISRGIISTKETRRLKELYERRKCKELLYELIRLKELQFKFPIDHPYIGFLSYYKSAIDKNPETVRQICNTLFKTEFSEIRKRLESPKSASRRIGPMFKNWLKSNFKFLDFSDFETCDELVFLKGGDKTLKKYANEKLKCQFPELSKGLDFIAKNKDKFIIGTAKFITRTGGGQTNQFYEATRLIKETICPPNVLKLAVIDGIAWLDNTMKHILETFKRNEFALSALLLKKFMSEGF